MDPLTQGLIGASLPQSVGKKQHVIVAGALGMLSGMAPDLDVLIRSSQDPLLYLQYHRQFTHSLLFIPIGSMLCAAVLYPLFAKRFGLSFGQSWLYCALGFSTHALLDACTSYGTQLFWPLSQQRVAWSNVSVVDPMFTLPVLILVALAVWRRSPVFARAAFVWALVYLSLGGIQKQRVEKVAWQLATERQHSPIRLAAKPSFANLLLWKVVYETDDEFYVDAIRVGVSTKVYQGDSVKKLDIARDFSWLDMSSQQAIDIGRFAHFSNGYLAVDPNNSMRIMDVRYSIVPNQINPLWSIQLSPNANKEEHVQYVVERESTDDSRRLFYKMILNN
ncbi:membrane-bound metal-dependent hydrolase [Vibrio caribbeanicus]|uniref:Membrane-bound metal-dependent hydrolase n=1 Tax=Vibrio caribbeanicus TaxID=701175 RepID=A0ACC4P2A6_9VIBR|nr:metal-dependent hydrolase [Vibrio caribbeanicus]KHD26841.1 membrane-bound metal-dependent hydrolase [Vibrio caribbeanicus]